MSAKANDISVMVAQSAAKIINVGYINGGALLRLA